MKHIVDQELVKQINKGNKKAFEKLYNNYFVYLCVCANSYIFNADESQDIVNEVFVNVWHKREELEHPIHAYLIKSVQNSSLNYLRSLRNQQKHLDEYRLGLLEFQEEYCRNNTTPLSYVEYNELKQQVRDTVTSLSPKNRTILEEYLYSNLSIEEIALKYNISTSTVRVHIKNGMDKLHTVLGKGFGVLLFFLF